MVLGAIGAGAAAGAAVTIVIKAIDQFTATFTKAEKQSLAVGAAFTALGIAGAAAVGGLIKMAGEFEQTNIAFKTMLGSAEEGERVLSELADFAQKTPFTITGIEANAKQLLAMSIEVDDLMPTLKSLGDVAAGLNVPLNRLALNFGQVKVQGRLTGRELRDFSVAGVPLIAELAKNLNIAEQEVKEMVSAGDIGFADVDRAFKTMSSSGGKFFDLMDAQSKTFLGRVSNIQDSFIRLGRIMGEVFLPVAKAVAIALERLVGFLQEHPLVAKFAAVILGLATAMALLLGLIIAIGVLQGPLIAGFATMGTVVTATTGAIGTFAVTITAALGPIGLIAVAAGLLAGLLISISDEADDAADEMDDFAISMNGAKNEADKLNDSLQRTIDILSRLFEIEKATKFFEAQVGGVTRADLPGPGPIFRPISGPGADIPLTELTQAELFRGLAGTPITQTGPGRNVTLINVEGSIIRENELTELINSTLSNDLETKIS